MFSSSVFLPHKGLCFGKKDVEVYLMLEDNKENVDVVELWIVDFKSRMFNLKYFAGLLHSRNAFKVCNYCSAFFLCIFLSSILRCSSTLNFGLLRGEKKKRSSLSAFITNVLSFFYFLRYPRNVQQRQLFLCCHSCCSHCSCGTCYVCICSMEWRHSTVAGRQTGLKWKPSLSDTYRL